MLFPLRTVMRYKELLKDYHFDESMMQPLYIPGMAEPPPLPPKRRPKRKMVGTLCPRLAHTHTHTHTHSPPAYCGQKVLAPR